MAVERGGGTGSAAGDPGVALERSVLQGATEEEALANARDAIREYLEARDDLFGESEIRELEVAV